MKNSLEYYRIWELSGGAVVAKEFKEILKEARKDNVESKLIVADKYESDGKYKDAFKW